MKEKLKVVLLVVVVTLSMYGSTALLCRREGEEAGSKDIWTTIHEDMAKKFSSVRSG